MNARDCTVDDFLASDDLTETPTLEYVKGFKYQARNDMVYKTNVCPPTDIVTDLVIWRKDGWVRILKYFAWDGCSAVAHDDPTNARACQLHDAGYYLLRIGKMPPEFKPQIDDELYCRMVNDNCWRWRACIYRWAVKTFGLGAAFIPRKIKYAPKKGGWR